MKINTEEVKHLQEYSRKYDSRPSATKSENIGENNECKIIPFLCDVKLIGKLI